MARRTTSPDLFSASAERERKRRAPLAERMRPTTIHEFVGQQHLLGPGRIVREMVESRTVHSLILWGPPGTGKTTLAHILAGAADADFVTFSAVLSGVRELRELVEQARDRQRLHGKATILFVDEIHRFNKAQQDAFLPHVEDGTIVLLGATTENPSFEVIAPLLSRTRVLVLEPLTADDLALVIDRALAASADALGVALTMTAEGRTFLSEQAHGDARIALGTIEVAASLGKQRKQTLLDLPLLEQALQQKALRYDKGGEEHYNVISAFIKSMRATDPDAAIYWMMRMLEAGEDPLFVARRMIIFAAEDIGNADPQALQVAVAAKDALHFVGMPEGRIPLAQAVTYLASAPKSNAALTALHAATEAVRQHGALPVPNALRNAPTALMKGLGYGAGYRYPHDHDGGIVEQDCLPSELANRRFYEPTDRGAETDIRERLRTARDLRKSSRPTEPATRSDDPHHRR